MLASIPPQGEDVRGPHVGSGKCPSHRLPSGGMSGDIAFDPKPLPAGSLADLLLGFARCLVLRI